MKKGITILLLVGCMVSLAGCQKSVSGRLVGKLLGEITSEDSGQNKKDKKGKETGGQEGQEQGDQEQKGREKNSREQEGEGIFGGEESGTGKLSQKVSSFSWQTEKELGIMLDENYRSEWFQSQQLMDVTYDSLSLMGEDYPGLAVALDQYHEAREQQVTAWKQQYLPYVRGEQGNQYFYPYEYQEKLWMQRADSLAVSFVTRHYEYTGGAHGITAFTAKTYDSASGRELALEDVAVDLRQLADAVVKELEANFPMEYADGNYRDIVERQILGNGSNSSATWALNYYGMVFYYGSYELGAYAMGCPEVIVPFAKYPGLFREAYTRIPEEYALCLRPEGTLYDDTDGDGEVEAISIVSYDSPEGYAGEEMQIHIGETQTDHTSYGWLDQAYLMRQKDGSLYLCMNVIASGDDGFLQIFRITGENAVYLKDATGIILGIPEKPSCFKMIYDMDAMGTYSGYQYSCLGNDGTPGPLEEGYTVFTYPDIDGQVNERSVTAKIPVPVWMIYEDGTTASAPEQIPAGTVLYLRRTDNETYVEMEMEDGRRCQVRGDFTTWPKTINGVNESDCFDGIAYAG